MARGDPNTHTFSVFQHRGSQLTGATCLNANADFTAARRLITQAEPIAPATLEATHRPLKLALRER